MEMEFFRRAIKQIRSQLGVLTTSQRLVVLLCVVIMGGAIFWMVRYAGQRVMVPLLNQPFTEEERQRIINQFEDWQQRYDASGDRILVPTEDWRRLIGRLGYAQLLPDDTSLGWASLLDESSIWEPAEQRETKNLIVLQTMLAQALEEGFAGVESAKVFINKAEKRRVSNVVPMARASVILTLSKGEEATTRLGTAIADFVSGANQNMKRENVSVIANGQKLKVIPAGEQAPSEYWETKIFYEQYVRDKIISILEVDNALVQVDVTPQMDETEQIIVSIPNEESGKSWLPAIQTSSSEQNSSNAPPGQGPGIAANVGSGGGAAGGGGRSETTEQSETTRQPFPGSETVKTRKAPGGITDITVSVSYPKTFFKQIAKERAQDKQAEPSEEEVQAQIDLETPELRKKIMGAIGFKTDSVEDESRIFIGTYLDSASVLASGLEISGEGELAGESTAGSMSNLVRGYGKQIAVSVLALMSLFMVLMMVRKAGGPIEMEEEEAEALLKPGKKPLDAMSPEDSNFTEAEDAGGLLTGVELDEHTVQSQQMLEQIRDMVKESPDSVANLVSKWIVQKD